MVTLYNKERYVIHCRTLKQAVEYGLLLTKVHRALKLKQSTWLRPYIVLNSEKGKNATNKFEKHHYKLLNNAIYGKTMENEHKRVNVKLIRKKGWRDGAKTLIGELYSHSCSIFHENVVAIQLARTDVTIRKPVFVGLAVLNLSKTRLCRFHYGFLKKHLSDTVDGVYTVSESRVTLIRGNDLYALMKANLHEFDTSEYPADNQFESRR